MAVAPGPQKLTIGRETIVLVQITEKMHHRAANPSSTAFSRGSRNAVDCIRVDSNNFIAVSALEHWNF